MNASFHGKAVISVRQVNRKRRSIRLAAVVCVLLVLTGCVRGGGQKDTAFRLYLSAEPAAMDPNVITGTAAETVFALLFEGLTAVDGDGTVRPAAAEDWAVSADGLTYVFTLAEGYWHTADEDETAPRAVTAADFAFGIRRAMQAGRADEVRSVRAEDDRTLTVQIRHADDTFPARLASAPYLPCQEEFFEATGGRYGLEARYSLTNGAFRLTRWEHGVSLRMEKCPDHRDAAAIAPDTVIYRIGAEQTAAALQSGTLDVARLSAEEAQKATAAGLTVEQQADTLTAIRFNAAVGVLNNAAVRCALRDAIEWTLLDRADGTAATGFVPPAATAGGVRYREKAGAIAVSTAPAMAKYALESGLSELGVTACPTLTVLCADDADSEAAARLIVQSWQKHLSLYFHMESVPAHTLTARLEAGDYEIALATAVGAGERATACLAVFGSAADNPWHEVRDAAVDRLLARMDEDDISTLEAVERALYDAALCIPLRFDHRFIGWSKGVSIPVRPFSGWVDIRRAERK